MINQVEQYSNFDDTFSIGSWFQVRESEIIDQNTWKNFSEKEGTRPVVIARGYSPALSPNTVVYPRSTSGDENKLDHPAHTIHDEESNCKINKLGRIVADCPCTVSSLLIQKQFWSCNEPFGSDALHQLQSWARLRW